MALFSYQASDLFQWIAGKSDFVLLDVRNKVDFERFKVEGPYPFTMMNISYFDFMEIEDECVGRLPAKNTPIRIVCAKEGSAQYVAEILEKHGFIDVGFLAGGIKSWGNLLVPKRLSLGPGYEFYQFIRPGKGSCSYGLVAGEQMMLIDPSRNIEFYRDFADDHNCRIVQTAETHLQADYIAGSRLLSEQTGARIFANENDFKEAKIPYIPLQNDADIGFGNGCPTITVRFAPGHTPGSTMFLIDSRYLIAGDTVFIKSIGRPDLGGKVDEWSDYLFDTIRKVAAMDGSTTILPAHFIDWSEANNKLTFAEPLDKVRSYNKDIYAIDNKDDFLAFIKANMREQPPEYATIRLVNANLKQVDDEEAEVLDLGKNECAASAYAAQQKA
ncbi:MBL fold metallo-hydrolase [Desulfofustis limnaeus]|uniref:Rhodanese domain-containing protein n=1 Tax=Desulfofustis limnaeus TaxID=2740163 RepID=A0ABN6M3V2_9BACT|nr:MBL fold metallo-hydrolase [Desulfofustis limnaeus]BDD87578.1 hypothetical protein DPPLL_19430 [Desulfofustis limnaeus]